MKFIVASLGLLCLVLVVANRSWMVNLNLGVVPDWPELEKLNTEANAGFGSETVGNSLTSNGVTALKTSLSDLWGIAIVDVVIERVLLNAANEVEIALAVVSATNPTTINTSISFVLEYKGSNAQPLSLLVTPSMISSLKSGSQDKTGLGLDAGNYFIIYTAMSGIATLFGMAFAITQARQTRKLSQVAGTGHGQTVFTVDNVLFDKEASNL